MSRVAAVTSESVYVTWK